jgi:nickel-dependent lactate racemase
MEILIPYGREKIPVLVPDTVRLKVVNPNTVPIRPPGDLFRGALRNPMGRRDLAGFLRDAKDVLVIVNDATRPTPTKDVLDLISGYLEGLEVSYLVATGAHRAPTDDEYRYIFGPFYDELKDRIFAHDARRDEDLEYVAESRNGTKIFLNKRVLAAGKIIVISSVEPHYFAGYTGGRKSFLPGVTGYETITQNHKLALSPRAQALALEGNPVNEDMEDCMSRIDKDIFSIMTVLDADHRIAAVTTGDIDSSFHGAIENAKEIFCVGLEEKADVVVTVAPYPMDIDLYQSQKAIDNGKLALKEGGILLLVSKCRMGTGDEKFIELMSSTKTPQETMEKISGEYQLGYHKAAKMAEICLRAELWGVTDLGPSVLRSIFIRPFEKLQEAFDEAVRVKGPQCSMLVFQSGSLTVPLLEAAKAH